MKFNPFKPNSIVTSGMFAGRFEELLTLEKALFQTKHGNPQHFLIHGERGIGKTSLTFVLNGLANGRFQGPNKTQFSFITAQIEVQPTTTCTDLILKIGREIARGIKEREIFRNAASGAWDFITNWEVGGIKFNKSATSEPMEQIEDLCDLIRDSAQRLDKAIDGFLITIDEADNASEVARLGEFIKLFTERLTRMGVANVLLGMAGISNVIEKIRSSHESATRILSPILLEPLSESERKQVIQMGLNSVGDLAPKVSITPEAEDWISRYSEGYPHFIQQYAFCGYDTDNDNSIDLKDVEYGAFREHGALDQLGTRYFSDMYKVQINSDEYRLVLQAMASSPEKYVTRKFIEDTTKIKKTTLGNALQALKNLIERLWKTLIHELYFRNESLENVQIIEGKG